MKNLIRLAAFLLLMNVCALAQIVTYGNVGVLVDQTFRAGSGASVPIPITTGQFNGMNYFKIEFTPLANSNITACTVAVDSQVGSANWVFGGAIGAQVCTSEGNTSAGPISANQVQVDISVTGVGAVRVRLLGAMSTFATSGTGTITGVTAGTGITGGGLSGTVTVGLATQITAGTCTSCNLTYNAQGQLTAATNGSGGSVNIFGTPTNAQWAQWTNATTIQGVNTIPLATTGAGGVSGVLGVANGGVPTGTVGQLVTYNNSNLPTATSVFVDKTQSGGTGAQITGPITVSGATPVFSGTCPSSAPTTPGSGNGGFGLDVNCNFAAAIGTGAYYNTPLLNAVSQYNLPMLSQVAGSLTPPLLTNSPISYASGTTLSSSQALTPTANWSVARGGFYDKEQWTANNTSGNPDLALDFSDGGTRSSSSSNLIITLGSAVSGVAFRLSTPSGTLLNSGVQFTDNSFNEVDSTASLFELGIGTPGGLTNPIFTATQNGVGVQITNGGNLVPLSTGKIEANNLLFSGSTLIALGTAPTSGQCLEYNGTNITGTSCGGGSGTVTSVAQTVPSWLTVTGGPITTSGTLAIAATTGQTSHQVIGTCGSATSFAPCSLVAADIPTLNQNTTGTSANVTGIVAIANGGTGNGTTVGSYNYFGNGTGSSAAPAFGAIPAAAIPVLNQNTTGTAANLSGTPALPNGTTATTQTTGDNTTKLATDAFVLTNALTNPMTTLGDMVYGGASGVSTRLAGPATPNGVPESLTSTPSGSAAVAPVWSLPGVGGRAITGTTSTDTIVAADCSPKRVEYTGSVAVAVTLPTATTLAVANCVFKVTNNTSGSSTALTITPTTWTINGNATATIAQGQVATIYVDPNSSTNWAADISEQSLTAGSNITFTRSATGLSIASTGGSGVTSIATTSPITGGTITTTGTIACATCVTSAASLVSNAVVLGGGSQASATSDLQFSAHLLNDTTSTQSLTYAGGADASANSILGGVTVRGANETGAGGATSQGGFVLIEGGTNAATNAASQAGSVQILPGASTGGTQGLQGLGLQQAVYIKGATVTQWNLECESAAMTVTDCGATPTTWLGITELVNANTTQVTTDGQSPVNASAAVTLGHTVCAGSTAGKVTDSGGTASCTNAQGATVGIVMAVAGSWTLPDTTTFTATTTLPLVQMNTAVQLSSGGGGSALSAVTGASAQATGTETAAGNNYTFAGVETAALTYPFIFQNTSASNNSSGALIVYTAGAGTAQVPLLIVEHTAAGSLINAINGGTVTNGVESGGTSEFSVSATGAGTLNASLSINGGTALTTTNQSGTGSLCLTTNCAMTTPNLGTPSAATLTNATGLPINGVVSATGAIATIADGNNPLVINCALTSGTTCLTTGETTAATTAGAVEHQITTLTTTTAIPLQITQGAAGPANSAAPNLFTISAAAAGGAAGASNAGSLGAGIALLTGAGSAGGATTGIGGAGGSLSMTEGAGGAAGGTATNNGGNGGGLTWTTGAGGNGGTGAATAGSGGGITWTLGAPGTNSATGTAGTVGQFQITGNAPASTANAAGVAAGTIFNVTGVAGGASSNAAGTGGIGSIATIASGTGGAGSGTNAIGGAGGTINFNSGGGGGGTGTGSGGAGGAVTVLTGNGGASNSTATNPNGGNFTITLGKAGIGGSGTAGASGQVSIAGTAIASTASATGLSAGTIFNLQGLTGGATSNAAGTAGTGSVVALNSGTGGAGTGTNAVGGAGGAFNITAGAGGASLGTGANANGGSIILTPGAAGTGGSGTAGVIGNVQVAAGALQVGSATCTVFGTAGGLCATEGTSATNVASASNLYPDSTAHEWKAATNGATTYGLMVRAQPGAINNTALTGSVATATLCAASAGACNVAGQYHISYNIWGSGTACASVTAGSVVNTVTWTDEAGTAHSAIPVPLYDQKSAALNVTGTFNFNTALGTEGATGEMTISTNGTVIQYTTTYTACTTGTGTYNIRAAVTRLQ